MTQIEAEERRTTRHSDNIETWCSSHQIEWRKEWKKAANFAKDHWALLGTASLVLSAIAVHFYLIEEGIPLSITSLEIITSLPILFALMMFAFSSLLSAATLPARLLLRRGKHSGNSLLDEISKERKNDPHQRMLLMLVWCAGVITPSLSATYALLHWKFSLIGGYPGFFVAVSALHSIFLALIVLLVPRRRRGLYLKDNWHTLAWCGALQTIVMISIGAIVESRAEGEMFYLIFLAIMSALAVAQLFIAQVFWDITRSHNPVMQGCGVTAIVMAVICVMPPLNHTFVGYIMQSSATGGRGCSIFTWAPDATIPPSLHPPVSADISHSIDLKISMSAQGVFYVRPWPGDRNQRIAMVPHSDVTEVASCSE